MSEFGRSDAVYPAALLALAGDVKGAGPLAPPRIAVSLANTRCGDVCGWHVRLDAGGRATALSHEVRACVFVQAGAALLARAGVGLDAAGLSRLMAEVAAMLAGGRPPFAPFDGFALLAAARTLPQRHACVLLPLEALALAFRDGAAADSR